MEAERKKPSYGWEEEDAKMEITDNRFLNNLMTETAAEIMGVFEEFLNKKGIEMPNEEKNDADNPAILYGYDYYPMENEVKDLLETLLHQGRSEFEEAGE